MAHSTSRLSPPPVLRLRVWSLALVCALGPLAGARAEVAGELRVSLQGGFDSNVRRDYREVGPAKDAVGSLVLSADGRYTGERLEARAGYDGGGRKFLHYPSEDLLTQALVLDGSYVLGRHLIAGLEAGAKDRRGGDRDYTDLRAGPFLQLIPEPRLDVRLSAGAHRFLYWKGFDYSFRGPEGALQVRYRLSRRHGVLGFGHLGTRVFASDSRPPPGFLVARAARRKDSILEAGLGYSFRGPFAFTATYSFAEAASSSFGEGWRRHRLALTSGVRLPLELLLLLQAQAQLTRYPDGVFLSADIILREDEENSNHASVKLVRALSERLDLEGRYALYQNRLPQNGLTYLRHVAWMGVTFRL